MISASDNNLAAKILCGAYIQLDELIAARFAARDIKLHQRRKALSLLAGPNKTNFRGRGIDFEEVRAYQPGDDIRTIDWRVTARSGHPYTKLFREERERPLLVVTDQRQGMFFGSQTCFKSVTACYVSALIAWAGLHNNDRIGGLVHGNNGHREIRPRRCRQALLSLANHLYAFNHQLSRDTGVDLDNATTLLQTLTELRRIARPGSAIFLVSDFSGFSPAQHLQHLHQLARHSEITALFIYDPLERELPPPGQYSVTDGRQRSLIDTASKHQRQLYREHFTTRQEQLQRQLGQLGIPLIGVATDESPLQKLLYYYSATRFRGIR